MGNQTVDGPHLIPLYFEFIQ